MHKIRKKALSSVQSCLHMSCTEVQYVGDFLGQMLQVASTYFLLDKYNKSYPCLKVEQANFSHKHSSLCKVISSWSSLVCLLQNWIMWHLMKEQEKILSIDVGKKSKFCVHTTCLGRALAEMESQNCQIQPWDFRAVEPLLPGISSSATEELRLKINEN